MKSFWTVCLVVVATFAVSFADAPRLVNFQGRLTDGSGSPVADGSYSVTFVLYDAATGGVALWSETQSVSTGGGLFTALLGSITPFDASLLSGPGRYLGISVGADPELLPRTRLVSAPYALYAASGGGWTDAGGSVHTSTPGDLVGIGTTSPTHALHVVEPNASLFVSRFESGSSLASIVELSNTGLPVTWEWAISGSASAFGQVPPGSMYFYRQGSSGTSMVLKPNGQVVLGAYDAISGRLVVVDSSVNGKAVVGRATGTSTNIGLQGEADSTVNNPLQYSTGVYGGAGWWGVGVRGQGAIGLHGSGFAGTNSAECVGVKAEAAHPGSQDSYGVSALATGTGTNYGVLTQASGSGASYGIYAYAYGTGSNNGIYASAAGGASNYAGYFFGNTHVQGTLSKSAGAFKIDHPLDPQNRYLQHSFVESPDMMNVYNGNVVLNAQGEALVPLPDYFEALNQDFRYQLTCIGGYAPIYVADKIADNRFRIAGGTAGLEVSWQVTGIRKDAYAQAHRLSVEVEKRPDERGRYLHPELFGQEAARAIGRAELPTASVGRSPDRP
jgi:hypothetical protein